MVSGTAIEPRTCRIILETVIAVVLGFLSGPLASAQAIRVGDPAPSLDGLNWVGNDAKAPLEDGRFRVLFVWGTWCPISIEYLPLIADLHRRTFDRVDVLGVCLGEDSFIEATAIVESLGDEVPYPVAIDGPSAVFTKVWMKGSGQYRLPAAFIVDRRGTIVWIGHAARVEGVLSEVLAGEWDLAAAEERHRISRERAVESMLAYERLTAVRELELDLKLARSQGLWGAVVESVEGILSIDKKREIEHFLSKYEGLVRMGDVHAAAAYGRELVDRLLVARARELNVLAWFVVDPDQEMPDRDLTLALKAARRSNVLSGYNDAAKLDTLAKVYFDLGNTEAALSYQRIAVLNAKESRLKKVLRDRLARYENERKSEK